MHSIERSGLVTECSLKEEELDLSPFSLSKPNAFHRKSAPTHSVGSESEANAKQLEETDEDKEKERGREAEWLPSKACYEAAIQYKAKATESEVTAETC
jgi:hypothetical protein